MKKPLLNHLPSELHPYDAIQWTSGGPVGFAIPCEDCVYCAPHVVRSRDRFVVHRVHPSGDLRCQCLSISTDLEGQGAIQRALRARVVEMPDLQAHRHLNSVLGCLVARGWIRTSVPFQDLIYSQAALAACIPRQTDTGT